MNKKGGNIMETEQENSGMENPEFSVDLENFEINTDCEI